MSWKWLLSRKQKCLLAASDGVTAIEFGLLAPALFLLLFGVMEFGRMVWTQTGLHYSVEEAARCASVNASVCGTPAQIAAYAAGSVSELNLASSVFTVTSPSCGHQVTASLKYAFLSNFFTTSPILTATACFS